MKALVVGASRGIGLELVRQLRADAAEVTATARDEAGLARLRAQGAQALELDVTKADCAARLQASSGAAGFGLVIVNAGVYGPRSAGLEPPSRDDFDRVMHTNVLGAMRVLAALDGSVLAAGARVAVVSSKMGSIGARASTSGWLYRASKAALNSVLKDASLVLAGQATCVALHPGWVRTDMGGAGAELDVADSAAGILRTLAGLTPADHGGFFDHRGTPIPW